MTALGIFGGSFNPPHIAHQLACLYALETEAIDRVIMVPTFSHPFAKDAELVPFADRLAMCELCAAAIPGRVEVSAIEGDLGQIPSHTFDTLVALSAKYPQASLRLIIGSDILAERHLWHRWDDVVALAPLLLLPRPTAGHRPTGPILPDIASSAIRERIRARDFSGGLVSLAVMDYIAHRGLYL